MVQCYRMEALILDQVWDDLSGSCTAQLAWRTWTLMVGRLLRWKTDVDTTGRKLGARKSLLSLYLFDQFVDLSLFTYKALFRSLGSCRLLFSHGVLGG